MGDWSLGDAAVVDLVRRLTFGCAVMRSRAAEDGDLRRQQTLPSPDMKHHSNAAADVAVAERGVSLLFFGA